MQPWSQGTAVPRPIAGSDDFRLQTESAASTNAKLLLGDCTAVEGQGPGITIRCGYELQDLRSDELGVGPFGDKSTDVVVVDGKITSIAETGSLGQRIRAAVMGSVRGLDASPTP